MQQAKRETESEEILSRLGDLEKVLSSLADKDALKIFVEAGEGIESSTRAIKKLDLTQKRYYVWLKRLIDAGLIEKRQNNYVQTMLGKLAFKMGTALLNAVNQRDQLELADKLMRSNMLSAKEKEEVLGAISKKELLETASLSDLIHEVKMITGYDDFVEEVLGMLEDARDSVYIATNKFDTRVMEASFRLIDSGLRFFYLGTEQEGFPESIQALRIVLLQPHAIKIIRRLLDSKELNVRLAEQHLSHCFVVVDGEHGVIELPHPTSHDFYVGFRFKNAFFCQKLVETFNSLYEKGKVDPRVNLAKKFLTLHK